MVVNMLCEIFCITHWSLGVLGAVSQTQPTIWCYCEVSSYLMFDNAFRLLGLNGDESTLVQVIYLCRQPPSHYLNQCLHMICRPCAMSQYSVTKPYCVNMSVVATSTAFKIPSYYQ